MKIKVTKTPFPDLVTVDIDYFKDERGFFIEPWHQRDFAEGGLPFTFVQEGHSRSSKGVIRGLHFQNTTAPMAKFVRCIVGKVFEVAVDLRTSSPTFGKAFTIELSAENKTQLYVPVGFALGFGVLSDYAEVLYKQTGFYTPTAEGSLLWNDPDVSVQWPIKKPMLSEKDKKAKTLKEYLKNPAFK